MKIILNILIVLIYTYFCDSSVYDWHVKTIEHDSDFGDDLKVQTALNRERQQDLLKIAGKMSDTDHNTNLYYKQTNRNKNFEPNKILPQNIQNDGKQEFKNNHNIYENFEYLKNREEQKRYNKNMDNHIEDNNSYHDLKLPISHGDNSKNKDIHISINEMNGANNKTFKDNKERSKISHCCEKYIDIDNFVGTNLFDITAKRCFSNEEVALLAIRKDFEILIPKNLPQCLFTDQMIALLLNYFYISHQMIVRMPILKTNYLTQKAFYDTLGGYLNFYMVPVSKYSYYAGQISLNTAQKVLTLYKETKQFLNTNGNGWKTSLQNVLEELKSIHIEPLNIPELNQDICEEYCMQLDMDRDDYDLNDDRMIVSLPKLEIDVRSNCLGNIWLPFRDKNIFDLKSENSAYILVQFYETITKCYRCEKIDQQYYNEQFRSWLLDNINAHLSNEQFYPGLGAILRVYEYLKEIKNVLSISKDNFIAKINGDEDQINNHNLEIKSKHIENIKNAKHKLRDRKNYKEKINKNNEPIEKDGKKNYHNHYEFMKNIEDHKYKSIKLQEEEDLPEHQSTLDKLRNLDLTVPQTVAVVITVVIIILIIIICCCKRKKKKVDSSLLTKKNSSSSSSNLLNSPVRFFHIRNKSASSIDNKKTKKSVQIEKKPLRNSDTSMSSSPVRVKKSKDSGGSKGKESGKK
ncbi:uncharacterized protein ACRADG_000729 isoform 2-T2 [Cochliomyia hominivorax]